MKTRNQSKSSAWLVIVYVIGGISAGLLALVVMFFASVGMVVQETPEWVEKNCRIPCESLQVKEAIFDMDSNELEVRLETSPSEQFDRAVGVSRLETLWTRVRPTATGEWAGNLAVAGVPPRRANAVLLHRP